MKLVSFGHQHAHRQSPIHRLPARTKMGVAAVIIAGTVLAPLNWTGWFLGVPAILICIVFLSRISLVFLLQRLLVLSPFILGVAAANAWEPVGSARGIAAAVKSGICLLTVILVSSTTPLSRLLKVLRTWHVPALLITTVALLHRYLVVLADEAERMRRARYSRTFTSGRTFRWRSLASVVGQLFVRASERAERIYDAMCARGWR